MHALFHVAARVALLVAGGAAVLRAQTVCDADGRRPAPQPGFGLFQCVGGACGIFDGTDAAPEHRFTVEPRLWHVAHPGPADGILEEGDQLVAVDGLPITTRRAGQRLARLRADTPLSLTVRRAGVLRTVQIRPAVGCAYPTLVVTDTGELPAELSRAPRAPAPVRAEAPFELGLTLACDECRWVRRYDGSLAWHTLEVPRVLAVQPDGPAARSGLATGDRLLTVDGRAVVSEAGARYLGTIRPRQRVRIGFARGDSTLTTTLTTDEPRPRD
jgi:membrane-associated protease RseP (regulator of RpoE activity)